MAGSVRSVIASRRGDSADATIDHVGWLAAKVPNDDPLAVEEATDVASEWCRTYGFKTFTMYDHRTHPDDYIAHAVANIDLRSIDRAGQVESVTRPAFTIDRSDVANDNETAAPDDVR